MDDFEKDIRPTYFVEDENYLCKENVFTIDKKIEFLLEDYTPVCINISFIFNKNNDEGEIYIFIENKVFQYSYLFHVYTCKGNYDSAIICPEILSGLLVCIDWKKFPQIFKEGPKKNVPYIYSVLKRNISDGAFFSIRSFEKYMNLLYGHRIFINYLYHNTLMSTHVDRLQKTYLRTKEIRESSSYLCYYCKNLKDIYNTILLKKSEILSFFKELIHIKNMDDQVLLIQKFNSEEIRKNNRRMNRNYSPV